jgi:integrase/recombinase XerC
MSNFLVPYCRWLDAAGKAEATIKKKILIITAIERDVGRRLVELDQDDIAGWLAGRRGAGTKRCYHSHLSAAFNWLIGRGELDRSPMAGLPAAKAPEYEPRPPSAQQWNIILARALRPYWVWAVLAAGAGLRCCDIAQLDRDDVDEQRIYIRHSKGGKSRSVHTHPFVWAAVRDLPPGPVARRADGQLVTASNISTQCAHHFRRVGADVTMHQLRHLFGTALYEQGTDLFVIQREMGHASVEYTRIYTRVGDRQGARAVTALPIFAAAS